MKEKEELENMVLRTFFLIIKNPQRLYAWVRCDIGHDIVRPL